MTSSNTPSGSAHRDDGRPRVAGNGGNQPLWLGIGVIVLLGLALFAVLNARRTAITAPAVKPRVADLAVPAPIPPLYIPPEPTPPVIAMPAAPPPVRLRTIDTVRPAIPIGTQPSPPAPPAAYVPPIAPVEARPPPGPAVVFDAGEAATGTISGGTLPPPSSAAGASGPWVTARARAGRLANRASIVAQGTLIPAVLETALDSTQPGQVRALVSNDVVNVIGNRVLIPRGSRLFGQYRGELAPGQKRANVQWGRLVRPDGVTIDLDSPASDPLGRAGIRGAVDTHFLERLGGALLQSTLDFGTFAASRAVFDGSVFVTVPNTGGTTSSLVGPPPKPTLRVRQGTRIAVFVTRDLDFSGVGSDE